MNDIREMSVSMQRVGDLISIVKNITLLWHETPYFFKSHFICNLYEFILQNMYKRIQWHVEECSVALLCN
jgi:hypothetical protein